jgi:hypothetical protein
MADAKAPAKVQQRSVCVICDQRFIYEAPRDADPPPTCGHLHCRARHEWTAEQWDGQARMAGARLAAGHMIETYTDDAGDRRQRRVPVVLNDLDQEALARVAGRPAA